MRFGVGFKSLHPLLRFRNHRLRHSALLGQATCQHSHVLPMKKVQHPIVHASHPRAKFINPAFQCVRQRPAQFKTKHRQPPDQRLAFAKRTSILAMQFVKPLQNRRRSVRIAMENHLGGRHRRSISRSVESDVYSHICEYVSSKTPIPGLQWRFRVRGKRSSTRAVELWNPATANNNRCHKQPQT